MKLIILIFVGFVWLLARGRDYFLWYGFEMCGKANAVINELNGENKMLKKVIKEMQKLKDMDYEGTDEVKELKRELKKYFVFCNHLFVLPLLHLNICKLK